LVLKEKADTRVKPEHDVCNLLELICPFFMIIEPETKCLSEKFFRQAFTF